MTCRRRRWWTWGARHLTFALSSCAARFAPAVGYDVPVEALVDLGCAPPHLSLVLVCPSFRPRSGVRRAGGGAGVPGVRATSPLPWPRVPLVSPPQWGMTCRRRRWWTWGARHLTFALSSCAARFAPAVGYDVPVEALVDLGCAPPHLSLVLVCPSFRPRSGVRRAGGGAGGLGVRAGLGGHQRRAAPHVHRHGAPLRFGVGWVTSTLHACSGGGRRRAVAFTTSAAAPAVLRAWSLAPPPWH